MANIQLIKKTFKIVAFGENWRHFDRHFHHLIRLRNLIWSSPTITNKQRIKPTVEYGEISCLNAIYCLYQDILKSPSEAEF